MHERGDCVAPCCVVRSLLVSCGRLRCQINLIEHPLGNPILSLSDFLQSIESCDAWLLNAGGCVRHRGHLKLPRIFTTAGNRNEHVNGK